MKEEQIKRIIDEKGRISLKSVLKDDEKLFAAINNKDDENVLVIYTEERLNEILNKMKEKFTTEQDINEKEKIKKMYKIYLAGIRELLVSEKGRIALPMDLLKKIGIFENDEIIIRKDLEEFEITKKKQ